MLVAEQRPALACKNPGCPGVLLTIGRRSICSVCRQISSAPRVKHQERRKTDLSDPQVIDMLALARSRNTRDFTILGFLASGFRRSEIVGGDDNGVTLPGVQVGDVHVDEEYVWVHGKNDKEIQQPVPRLILELGLSFGQREGKLIEWVTTHAVGELVKAYAESCGLPDAQLVTSHRFRHWFSRRVKEHGGLRQGVEGLVEWADVMRHSRKGLGGVTTLGFYSGPFTTFDRRRDIVRSALQGILGQLASLPGRQTDTVSLRISQDSTISSASKSSESKHPLDIIGYITPPSGSSAESDSNPAPAETDRRCEWPHECTEKATVQVSAGWFCEPHSHDPFGDNSAPQTKPVDATVPGAAAPEAVDPSTVSTAATTDPQPSPPVTVPSATPTVPKDSRPRLASEQRRLSHGELVIAWQQLRHQQTGEAEKKKLWKTTRCAADPRCKKRIVVLDPSGWVCEEHRSDGRYHEPPDGWHP